MMAFRLLLSCVLLTSGFSVEISVFVQTGDSVQLDIQTQQLPEFDDLSWRNDKSENIVKYFHNSKEVKRHPSYKDKVDFNNKTFSLTLKNMQKNESGLYTARTSGVSDKNIVTYTVSVIDAVEAPVLTVNSNSSSPDHCSFTCNNMNISSIYNGSSCSPEEVTSDHYTLRLSCIGDSIMCNYSNPVSWKIDTKKVNEICTVNKGKLEAAPAFPSWVIVICLIALASAMAAVIGFCFYKRKKGTQTNEQTIYAEVDENIKPQKSLEMLKKSDYPQTVYDTTGDSGQTDVTNHTTPNDDPSGSLTEKSKPDTPVTIYSTIQQETKPAKTKTDHTIYGVVKKPSAGYESAHPQPE